MPGYADHESFLRAIFDAPDDDTPRLVYADFLEDNGELEQAEFIRVHIDMEKVRDSKPDTVEAARWKVLWTKREELIHAIKARYPQTYAGAWGGGRGFPAPTAIEGTVEELTDLDRFRERSVFERPDWFGAKRLKVTGGAIFDSSLFTAISDAPVADKVMELDLSGREEPRPTTAAVVGDTGVVEGVQFLHEYQIRPIINTVAVEALARHPLARRLTALDLRNNQLGNDAARALVRSPYLNRLTRLDLRDGNSFRGSAWTLVLERFGPDVAG